LNCTIDFVTVKEVYLQEPYHGQKKPTIICEPGTVEVLWYRMGPGASINFRMMAQFKKGAANLKKQVQEKGNKSIRKYKNRDVGISVYILYHSDGVIYEYKNDSSEYTLDENISFNLKGCSIVGSRGSAARIYVGPRQEKTLSIKSHSQGWSAKATKNNFVVKR